MSGGGSTQKTIGSGGIRRVGSSPILPPLKIKDAMQMMVRTDFSDQPRRLSLQPQSAREPSSNEKDGDMPIFHKKGGGGDTTPRSLSGSRSAREMTATTPSRKEDVLDDVPIVVDPSSSTPSTSSSSSSISLFDCLFGGGGAGTEITKPWEPPPPSPSSKKRSDDDGGTPLKRLDAAVTGYDLQPSVIITTKKRQEYITVGETVRFKSPWIQYETRQALENYRERFGNDRARMPKAVDAILGLVGNGRMATRTELRQLLDNTREDHDDGFMHHYMSVLMREMLLGEQHELVDEMIDFCLEKKVPPRCLVDFFDTCTIPLVYAEHQLYIAGWLYRITEHVDYRRHHHKARCFILKSCLQNQNVRLYQEYLKKTNASLDPPLNDDAIEETFRWELLESGSSQLMDAHLGFFESSGDDGNTPPAVAHACAIAYGGGPLGHFKRVMARLTAQSERNLTMTEQVLLSRGIAAGGSSEIFEYYLATFALATDKDAIECLVFQCVLHRQSHFIRRILEERGANNKDLRRKHIVKKLRADETYASANNNNNDDNEKLPLTRADRNVLRSRGITITAATANYSNSNNRDGKTCNLIAWRSQRRREFEECLDILEKYVPIEHDSSLSSPMLITLQSSSTSNRNNASKKSKGKKSVHNLFK